MTAIPRPRKPAGETEEEETPAPEPRLYSGIMGDGDTSGFEAAVQSLCSSFIPPQPK